MAKSIHECSNAGNAIEKTVTEGRFASAKLSFGRMTEGYWPVVLKENNFRYEGSSYLKGILALEEPITRKKIENKNF